MLSFISRSSHGEGAECSPTITAIGANHFWILAAGIFLCLAHMMKTLLTGMITWALCVGSALAQPHSQHAGGHGHGGHSNGAVTDQAPIGLGGGRSHGAGSLMFALRYGVMGMSGLQDGTQSLSEAELLDPNGSYQYRVVPRSMRTQMVMASAMYSPSRYLTVSAMVPYVFKEMDMVTRMGQGFRTQSNGFGDVGLFLMSPLVDSKEFYLQVKLGLSFPSGSINQQDRTPMSGASETQLPYLMQIGSGTWDLIPSVAIGGAKGSIAWGGRIAGVVRTSTNENGYRFGNIYSITGWGEWAFTPWLAVSLRLAWQDTYAIEGVDSRLPSNASAMTPSADPEYLGRRQFDGFIGFQVLGQEGLLADYGFAVEAGLPLWQSTTGPGLARSYFVTLGFTKNL